MELEKFKSRSALPRAVLKSGELNTAQSHISSKNLKFLHDIFTTLVDIKWRYTFIIFAATFFISWFCFACTWWLIIFIHGDLDENNLSNDTNWAPCVTNMYGFTSCYLFSVETQHTTGYGERTPTEECPEAIILMCIQNIFGLMVEASMVGILFAKMTRSKMRTRTLLFSKKAVISQREGSLCLMFRVGDMRKTHIIGANIQAQIILTKVTAEGEVINNFQSQLPVSVDGCQGNLFFIWPMVIVHKITQESPLYKLSATDLERESFEIVVIWEGTVESTGQTTQARSSYLNSEVLWGHRFEPIVKYNQKYQNFDINYAEFDKTVLVDTPLCSAAELSELFK